MRDLEIEVFIPAIIASTIGYTVYGFFFGFTPIFGNLQIPRYNLLSSSSIMRYSVYAQALQASVMPVLFTV
ncbi:hypothetical protein KDW_63080 [Dictyobacter vulcani]|uniref:ABC-2 type transporter domain-containing protein n=1 Tax=Dictyobacter vulcani TaxID=2607529 RepID=A0A5J4L3V3_9CHLR|nr:hypothetical protein KDW_63080 [Dictyobacter vulcani]